MFLSFKKKTLKKEKIERKRGSFIRLKVDHFFASHWEKMVNKKQNNQLKKWWIFNQKISCKFVLNIHINYFKYRPVDIA